MNFFKILLLCTICCCNGALSQIAINTALTTAQLVENHLLGSGVSVSNITFMGNSGQIGYFDGSSSTIGLNSGIVMSTGFVSNIIPPNEPSGSVGGPGDNDVLATAKSVNSNPYASSISTTNDAAILEFDFVPSGESVNFNFVFASEEYLNWVNTIYNDAFGFYISGPNPSGGNYSAQNFALVPGTAEPITISTIYPGLNSGYYIDNASSSSHSFNGFTVPIEIHFAVICGQTYHFKFAVADCEDAVLDTGIFLESGSFSSPGVNLNLSTISGDTAIYEGCSDANLFFTRPSWETSEILNVSFDVSGTAAMGTDYNSLTNPAIFPAGEDTVLMTITPVNDGINEEPELITITINYINACGDTSISSRSVWIFDEPVLNIIEEDITLQCKSDSVLVNVIPEGGVGEILLSWSDGNTGSTIYISGDIYGSIDYYVTMTDQCNNTFTDTLTLSVTQTLKIDTLIVGASSCEPTGWVSATTSGAIGIPLNTWTGPGSNNSNLIDATVWNDLSSGWYYFTVQDNICFDQDSVFVDITNPPIAKLTVTPEKGCGPLEVKMTNTSENADNYIWNFGNGQTLNVSTNDSQSQTYTNSAIIMLIATQGSQCADTAYASFYISTCGCTDPQSLNYNPLATFDDGSCNYPPPTAEGPNVFSPNGDNSNDLFFLNTTNSQSIYLVLLNRWGNIVYESEGLNPAWNGKTINGALCDEGVYFYKYIINGHNDQVLEGHGFVELFR